MKPGPLRPFHIAIAELMAALLLCGPLGYKELAEFCGLNKLTVGGLMRALYSRGVVRIGGWEADGDGRYRTALWQFADGKPDVPKPKPIGRRQKGRNITRTNILTNLGAQHGLHQQNGGTHTSGG